MSKVLNHIEQLVPEYQRFLQELVRIPSFTGDESKAQQLVKEKMRDLGIFEREVFCDDAPEFHPTGRDYARRPSLVGRVPGRGTAHFILNAHIDTAPIECESSWTRPPFGAVVEGHFLYGRGALDDKAGVAMILLLAESFLRSGQRLPGDLLIQSVIEDEDSGNGTLSCTRAGYRAEGAVIVDGTWPWDLIDSHLGQMWLELVITGVATPACSHHRAVHPVFLMMQALDRLQQWLNEANRRVPQWLGMASPYWMSVGQFHAGSWNGSVPEKCRCGIQIGFPPDSSPAELQEQIRQILAGIQTSHPGSSCELVVKELCTAAFWNPENAMTQALRQTLQATPELVGLAPKGINLVTSKGHCDLRHLRRADGSPTAACLYGPGGGHNPHVADECYRLDHFGPVAQVIARAILAFYQ